MGLDARADYEIRTRADNKGLDETFVSANKVASAMAALGNTKLEVATNTAPVDKLGLSLGGLVKFLGPGGAVLAGATGAGLALRRLKSDFEENVAAIDALNDRAKRFGQTVDEMDRIEFVAKQTGVDFNELAESAKFAQKNLAEAAATGKGAAAEALQALGLSAVDAGGRVKSFDQILLEAAGKFPAVASESQRTALALDIFGRSGDRLIPILNGGKQELAAMLLDAERLGTVYPELAAKADAYGDASDRLSRAWRQAKNAVADELLPALTVLKDFLTNQLDKAFDTAEERVGEFIQKMAGEGAAPDTIISELQKQLDETQRKIAEQERAIQRTTAAMDESTSAGLRRLGAQTELDGLLDRELALTSQITAMVDRQLPPVRDLVLLHKEEIAAMERGRELQDLALAADLEGARAWETVAEKINKATEAKRAFVIEPINPLDVTGGFGAQLEEPLLDVLDRLAELGHGWDDIDRAIADASDSIRSDLSNATFDWITQVTSGADLFERVWRRAIGNIAANFIDRDLLGGPGGSILGFLGDLLGGHATTPPVQQQSITVQQTIQTLTLPTTSDLVRANIQAQEAARQAARVSVLVPA